MVKLGIERRRNSHLMLKARQHWYNNEGGPFVVDGVNVTRRQMDVHGGPDPTHYRCETCQALEWTSRTTQTNRWHRHSCKNTGRLREEVIASCKRQGSEWWTHMHSCYWYGVAHDPTLNAPKMAVFYTTERGYREFWTRAGFHVNINKQRCFARACQVEPFLLSDMPRIDWKQYDLCLIHNRREVELYPRPTVPIILFCWDPWKGNPQAALNHYQPEHVISPSPQLWLDKMTMPKHTKVWLYAAGEGNYFTHPNLEPTRKCVDLVVLGALSSQHYAPRKAFQRQLESLPGRFLTLHLHEPNHGMTLPEAPLSEYNGFLNVYVDQIGRGRYATFGPCGGEAATIMAMKTYEVLGSGAIPILPEVPDLARLGIEPGVHYIPFSEIRANNKRLAYLLGHYSDHRHIAQAAVKWHQEHADRLLFDGFENVVQAATGGKFPRRRLDG